MCSKVDTPHLLTRPPPLEKRKINCSFQKIQTSTIWKNYEYLCSKKCDNKGLPQRNCQGGASPKMPPPPTTYGERSPPHRENGPHVERKHCPHRKNAPLGKKSPPWNFFIHSPSPPPGRTPTFAPLRAPIMTSTLSTNIYMNFYSDRLMFI